jgi:peroxiredoxin
MARLPESKLLDNGDLFPHLTVDRVGGGKLSLPGDLTQPFNVVLINRGHWCPFCIGQLKSFQSALPKLAAEGIGVVSISADPADKAAEVVKQNGLEFPVGFGASVNELATTLGVYFDPNPSHTTPYAHAAGFVLAPGNKVITAVYSSGAIGRLVWQDVLGFVQYVKSHA